MSIDRIQRVNELLRREIGTSLFRVFGAEEIDLAAITVTHVDVSRNLRTARVSVSVLGHEHERGRILGRLRRRRGQIQALINTDLKLKYTPRLEFQLDASVEKGDHVLGILMRMEEEAPLPPGEDE